MIPLLREPLLHFAVLGAACFGAFTLLEDPPAEAGDIVISAADQRQLAAAFERAWRRPPTTEELEGLLEDRMREELANREARALGMAEGDAVIRRRLRQKYEALIDQIAATLEPENGELEAWYRDHAERYREEPRFTLQQLFFGSDARDDAAADARRALALLAGAGPGDTRVAADALGIGRRFTAARDSELGRRFGAPFYEALSNLPAGRWSGPVPSAYGYHLVFIEERESARMPALAERRDEVLRDWREQRLLDARDDAYAALRQRYAVTIEAAERY